MTKTLPLLGLLVALAACSSEPADSSPETDAGDAGTDTMTDTTPDADTDTTLDATDDVDDDTDTTDDSGPDVDPTLDSDGDRIPDIDEITIWGTDPNVADSDGDGFDDGVEILDLAFDPEVNNFQFNPLIADRPVLSIELAEAPLIYATYETTSGSTESVGRERSAETREANTRSWGGSNSYAVEQTHSVGGSVGFEGWSMTGSVSYNYSYSTTRETSNEWSQEQSTENAQTRTAMESYETSNEIAESGGFLGVTVEVRNDGDIAYFLDNLTLTAYQLDPQAPEATTPVGVLSFGDGFLRTRLEPGESSAPLAFTAELDLPMVKSLLADSRNLMIAPATWLVEGDGTVDFELASTAINARTAEVIIDYGFEREPERYRVATPTGDTAGTLTAADALDRILRVPWEQGTFTYGLDDEGAERPTVQAVTRVRSFEASNEAATVWTVIHSYPIDSGADTQTDQYHPMDAAVDLESLIIDKGHTLQLVRVVDVDWDGLGERSEYAFGTDINNPDTDGDGCTDGLEVVGWEAPDGGTYRSDPTLVNTDRDAYTDCEEYERGTDPSDSDNLPPTLEGRVDIADGVRAVFGLTFSDPDGPVQAIGYAVDGGDEVMVDVTGTDGTYALEHLFTAAGTHEVVFRAFDGELFGEPVAVDYSVGVPSGAAHSWPIQGSSDGSYYGSVGSLQASPVYFVTGRDGAGRGGADTYYDGNPGILTGGPYTIGLEATFSAWVRFDAVYSTEAVFGQNGLIGLSVDPSFIAVHDLASNPYVGGDGNQIIRAPMSGHTGTDTYMLLTVTLSGGVASLYINGEPAGSGPFSATEAPYCQVFYGKPSNGESSCSDMNRAEDYENGLDAAFDDLLIYERALSANEVMALWLN